MEKRLLLAVALSFIVLGIYTSILPKPKQVVNKAVIAQPVENNLVSLTSPVSAVVPEITPVIASNTLQDNELYLIENDGLSLKFSKKGAFLYEVFDKKHNCILPIRNIGFVNEWSSFSFVASEITRGVVFSYRTVDGLEIKKTFRLKSDTALELSVLISGITDSKITSYNIAAGSFNPTLEKDQIASRYFESCAVVNGITIRKGAHGQKKPMDYDGHILWLALRDRYFCTVFTPQLSINKGVVNNIDGNVWATIFVPERPKPSDQAQIEDIYNIYVGMQDETALREFGAGAEKLINFGNFDSISKILLFFLKASHKITNSWGLAIIFITIFVYVVLFPLSFKSMLSMRKMQALQPKIEELKVHNKSNPQKLNVEIMELYKREKVNPLGGCLPMLLQIPVFFALYQLLMRFISLRGASFMWIKDLSAPDRLIIFKTTYPVMGNELNLLPLLMAAGMFFQQKMTSSQVSASPEAAQQQKIMAIMMPVLFGVLFYKLPAGLVLYWFINSLLMLAFQWKISKIKV